MRFKTKNMTHEVNAKAVQNITKGKESTEI